MILSRRLDVLLQASFSVVSTPQRESSLLVRFEGVPKIRYMVMSTDTCSG